MPITIRASYYLMLLISCLSTSLMAQDGHKAKIPQLDNPMTVEYLKKNLEKKSPRLVLNRQIEKELKQKLKTDPVLQNMYAALKLNATEIQKEPL
ncbi:MAG: hypothetical protein KDD15_31375, partial [Lewinella sp.]|nr:hypothetical protein [Lewinella sp.]